ncbi:hypothetical protein N0V90_008455 [Kalmusia sp. IMI 367209]|nr:hypothetical protein N0V90_008455 [Kalmusia sp. IMI 367209]
MSMPAQIRVERVDESNGSQIQYAPFKATIDSRTRRRLKRNHLAEEYNELEEHQKEDKKLRKAYIELSRQLAEKNNTIRDLEFQIEARRMGQIDLTEDETEGLREQLSQAKQEIEDLRASSIYRGDSRETSAFDTQMDGVYDDDEDDEPLLIVDPNDPDGPANEDIEPLPNGEFATRVLAISSQVTVDSLKTLTQTTHDSLAELSQLHPESIPDRISDKAVKRFESEIERLSELLGEAQGALRVVAIELQNANIVQPGASTDVIMTELRHTLENLHDEMEKLLPGCTSGLTNGELLHKIPALFEGLLAELGEKTTAAETFYKEARMFRSQYENTLGLLERSEARNNGLDEKVADLEESGEQNRQIIADLEERVTTMDTLANKQDADLKEKDAQMHGLRDEIEDRETDLTRLRDALEKYRADLDDLTQTTTRLEEEHRQTLADLEQDHAAEILDLQTQWQEENEARLQAEGEAEQKSDYIDELEENIQRIESEVSLLTEDLQELRARFAAETEEHEKTKVALQEEQDQVYACTNKIENLEEELEQLKVELAETRDYLETERAQREQTEASLDDANKQIEDLKERVSKEGMDSQELRSKLFQAQMEREEAVKSLEEEARERGAAFEDSLETETQAREAAEQTIADRDDQIARLEDDLAARNEEITRLNQELENVENDREEHVNTLGAQLADLKAKYAALENTSNSTIASLQANITDLTNEVNALKDDIERITTEAAETERSLREELAQKDQQIALLKENLDTSRDEYELLDKKYTNEVERFSEESNQFFKMQDKHARERNASEKKIKDLEARIQNMEDAAAQRALDHEAVIAEKETEIQELHLMGDTRAQTIVELQAQIDQLKDAFAAAEQDTRETIDNLTESQRLLQLQNEDLAAALKKRNADALQAVRDMQVKGVAVKSKAVDLHKVTNGKVAKVSERVKIGKKGRKQLKERKWRDSGFGADSDIENEEVNETGADLVVG